ncbi:MAG: hypothetical protein COA66_05255 [Arcobacter sp.]|nr:MAG: hypothetical protein COA66_05255 [Arcobacter sp.]
MYGKEPTLLQKIWALILFSLFLLLTFYMFFDAIVLLSKGIVNNENILVFMKTRMYFLGGVIFSINMLIMIIYLCIRNKQFYPQYQKYMFLVPLFIMFIFPHIISIAVHQYSKSINYIECEKESIYEFKYTKIVFAKDEASCKTYIK